MKILQLITGLGQGGAEQIVYDLATRLDRRQYDVAVCSILEPAGRQGVYAGHFREAGVDVLTLGMTAKWQVWRTRRLAHVLRRRKPDVLHCHLFHANVLGRRLGHRAEVPAIISTVHIQEQRWMPWRFWLSRRTDPLGTITVCVSEAVRDFQMAKTGLPSERFTVIPNGIDAEVFAEPRRSRGNVLREFGIPADARIVGSVGRLDPQKGYRHLVQAFGSLAKDDASLHLIIAGGGPEMMMLRGLASKQGCAGRIHLPGRRSDVADLLHVFDVFAMPSIYEGFGLSMVEAMAAAVPVVASDIPVLAEVLGAGEPDGPCGRMVPKGDPEQLASAIRDALDRAAPEQVERAHTRARERFGVLAMVARYAELYDSLARHTTDSQPPST